MPGTLYLVGTPIGNLEDMSPRAIRILGEVAVIAAEDTRHTIKLLNYFGIKTPMLSYHEHNEQERTPVIIARLQAGDSVALVTDAGLPGISDPGEVLVRAAIEAGLTVVPVPGPSACLLALAGSGLPAAGFFFAGFLPRQPKERRAAQRRVAGESGTIVLYEAPHRLPKTLADLAEALGGEREVVVARELTKVHEDFWRGSLAKALAHFESNPAKGEITIVLAGRPEEAGGEPALAEAVAEVGRLVEMGTSMAEAVRRVARQFGLPKNALYQAGLAQKKLAP